GVVLVITFVVMSVLGLVVFLHLRLISVQSKVTGYNQAGLKSFWLAEAGLQKYFYLLKNDSNYRDNYPDLVESLVDGSYSVSAAYDSGSSTYTLTSAGMAGAISRNLIQSVVVNVNSEGSGSEAFTKAMFIYGSRIEFANSSGTINGDIASVGDVRNETLTINGTVSEFVSDPGPFPPDYAGYESIADNVVGAMTFSSGQTYGAPGAEEIWYCTGKVTIQDNVTIYGSIISPTKTITMDSSANLLISPAPGMPALVGGTYIDGDSLTNATINGLVYSGKDLRINQMTDVTFNGSLIAENVCTFQWANNVTVNYDDALVTSPPPFFDEYYVGGISVTPEDDWEETY
ncbi:MAG: hypothetical protein WBC00_05860, partial [Candidatus Omnitrophota bacterium]